MPATSQSLPRAFEKTAAIIAACWDKALAGPEVLSIDDLKDVVSQTFGVEIEVYSIVFEGEHVKSMIERFEGGTKAKIWVKAGQSLEATRFAAVKELCHVIIDDTDDFSLPDITLIEKLTADAGVDLGDPENKGIWSERCAEVMARELMYPHELRQADLERVESGETSITALAIKYNAPELAISRCLRPSYIDSIGRMWTQVSKAKAA